MKKWRVRFHGRAVNAQGIFDWHTVTVEADTKEAALPKLYDTHEHISQSTFAEVGGEGAVWRYDAGGWRGVWVMEVKTLKGWEAVRPTGGKPYEYATRAEAARMLSVCYPDQLREQRLGGPEVVRVRDTTGAEVKRGN